MKREIIKPVVAINIFVVVLLLGVWLQQFLGEVRMSHLLGHNLPSVWYDNSFVGPAIMIAAFICGTVLELRRSKIAIFANLGVPFFLLVVVLVGCIRAWRDNPQEVQISLILVALPLSVLSALYAIFYRRIFIHSR